MASTTDLTAFTAGDLVISVYGDGDGSGNYSDNQASPIVLEEVGTDGSVVGQMVLPQTTTVTNGTTEYAISGEYGSSSEGSLELSADGQSLTIMGYGVNAQTFNQGGAAVYGDAALAQSTSVLGGLDTPVARVVADISYNGTVDTSTALYNLSNTNNPRSVATVNGTTFYISGQGVKGDTTQGLFLAQDGASNPTAIDTSTDTRTVEIYNGQLYVSRDSTQGPGGTSNISSYGGLPTSASTGTVLNGLDGSITLTAAEENSVNGSAVGQSVHLSPENYFFANATTLYIADSGNPKEGGLGDGGLQKWTYNGTSWTLDYTLSAGLNLVPDSASSGTTGLIGLTGVVVGDTVQLYATNATLGDLDPTYLYGITDTLDATTNPGESFTALVTAAPDTNIRGVAFAPTQAAVTPTVTSVVSGSTQSAATVTSGSELDVLSGGAIVGATILSGGTVVVSGGGTDTGSTVAHGGVETVLGSAGGDIVDGQQIVSAATATVSDEIVYNGGAVDLFLKGAQAKNITVMSGGSLNISGNATAIDTVISGGVVDLESAKGVLSGSLTFAGAGTLEFTAVTSAGYGDFAVISGFGAGDVIDETVIGPGATLATVMSGGNTVATITSGTVSESFTFAGSVSGLSLGSDGNGGEEIAI
jgi:autotransporter passenger strand-loop-strand repeat protein